jgi:acyl carrier protein
MNAPTCGEKPAHALYLPEIQKAVTEIWERCLERKDIGITDSFFDLGGNSITAMYIAAMINESFSIDLPFQRILEFSSIDRLAEFLLLNSENDGSGQARTKISIDAV